MRPLRADRTRAGQTRVNSSTRALHCDACSRRMQRKQPFKDPSADFMESTRRRRPENTHRAKDSAFEHAPKQRVARGRGPDRRRPHGACVVRLAATGGGDGFRRAASACATHKKTTSRHLLITDAACIGPPDDGRRSSQPQKHGFRLTPPHAARGEHAEAEAGVFS